MMHVDYQPETNQLRVVCDVREAEYVLSIPGARVADRRSDSPEFVMPATLAQGYALRAYGKGRVTWSKAAKAHLRELSQWAKMQEQIRVGAYWHQILPDHLWEYQRVAVEFMLNAGSALCADEMGTGKTVMGTALLGERLYGRERRGVPPALVVAPKSTLYWWKECIERYTALRAVVVTGSAAARRKLLAQDADVFILNHALLPKHSSFPAWDNKTPGRKEDGELNRDWSVIIVDEAHKMKDAKSQTARVLHKIGKRAAHRYAFTGTPIADSADDLWSVMHFVAPDEWPVRSKYRERYAITRVGWHGGYEVLGLEPSTEPELRKFLMPRFIRRTKEEVLGDIPEALPVQFLNVGMSDKQRQVYDQLRKEQMTKLPDGRILMATQQLQAHKIADYVTVGIPVLDDEGKVAGLTKPSNKLDALAEIVDSLAGEPLVVYSPSRKVVDFLADELPKKIKGLRVGKITGSVAAEARHAAVNLFQNGELDVIFLTSAGAEGITLTRASTGVFVQQDWSAVINQQVHDRIHRVGQEKHVRWIVLSAGDDTIDGGRRWALEQKVEIQQSILKDKDRLINGKDRQVDTSGATP